MFKAMTERNVSFPSAFLWGTATSAYQIEGDGRNTDWWRFEHVDGTTATEPCGDACDSWNRYEEDLDLIKSLGLNSYRFSIEWARIEPQQGKFSSGALAHYRDVIEACHHRCIVAVVTLHHFTLPLWVADAGGFENPEIAGWMGLYAKAVSVALGDLIDVACTINEPNIVALMGYLMGEFPPAMREWDRFSNVNTTMRDCHAAMRDALRAGPGDFPIGCCLSMQQWQAAEGGEGLLAMLVDEMEDEYLASLDGDDFVGVQCYTKIEIGPDGLVPSSGELTQMGYLFWPQCVEYTVRRAAQATDLPIVVTENGIGTNDDTQRIRYLTEALRGVKNIQNSGIDVRGYFQWSLLDNFEWSLGYGPKFGIVAVDRTTFERTPKPSAQWYAGTTRDFPESVT
jgi:beta-glucosidase